MGRKLRLFLFADAMILYIESPKGATKKLLEMSSPKFLDKRSIYKHQLYLYIEVKNNLKVKLNNSVYNHVKKNNTHSNKFNKRNAMFVHGKL